MSRVIKSAIWQTEPKIVEIPPLPKKEALVPELDEAARAQVLTRWRFQPATRNGLAVQAIGMVPIEFALKD